MLWKNPEISFLIYLYYNKYEVSLNMNVFLKCNLTLIFEIKI